MSERAAPRNVKTIREFIIIFDGSVLLCLNYYVYISEKI